METPVHPDATHANKIAEVQNVARDFLAYTLPDAHRIDVTKVAHTEIGEAAWKAEADVWQPNETLKSLGIETGRPVLDHRRYMVLFNSQLDVMEYELEGAEQ